MFFSISIQQHSFNSLSIAIHTSSSATPVLRHLPAHQQLQQQQSAHQQPAHQQKDYPALQQNLIQLRLIKINLNRPFTNQF